MDRKTVAFLEVAKSGSFSLSSESLGVSISAVSKYVTAMEEELGFALFFRTTRSIELTPEGRDLFVNLTRASDIIQETCRRLQTGLHDAKGLVRLCVPGNFGTSFVLRKLPALLDSYPDLNLEVSFFDETVDPVASGFDIVVQYDIPHEGQLTTRRIGRYPALLAASPDYLRANGVPKRPEDLEKHRCIGLHMHRADYVWQFEPRMRDSGLSAWTHRPGQRISIANQFDRAIAAAASGLGITITDICTAMPQLLSGELKIVLPEYQLARRDPTADIFIVFPYRDRIPRRVRVVADMLCSCMKAPELESFDPFQYQYCPD